MVVLYGAASRVVLDGFDKLKQQSIEDNVMRVKQAFQQELDQVASKALDWAHWTEFWEFAQGNYPDFFDQSTGIDSLKAINMNAVLATNLKGQVIAQAVVDLERSESIATPDSLLIYIANHPKWSIHQDTKAVKSGVIMLPEGPVLLASAPIVQSDFSGSIAGTLFFVRFIDESFISNLKNLTRLDLEFHRIDQPLEEVEVYQRLIAGEPLVTHIETDKIIGGHSLISDDSGKPILMLDLDLPRPIYAQALASRLQLVWVMFMVIGLVGLVFYLVFQRSIVNGFNRLTASVQQIAQEQSSETRIQVTGYDEFSQLGNNINTMIAALEQTQYELRESEARYALAAMGVNDGLWEWDTINDTMYFSGRWMEMLGYESKEYRDGSKFWPKHVHADDLPRVYSQFIEYLKGKTPLYEAEYRMQHKDGNYRWVLVRAVAERKNGRAVRMAGSLTDITQRGVFDPLTGLPNRQLMNEYLKHAHSYSQRHENAPAAVLFMDLNRFKEVNDSLGHQVGDLLLLEFSKRLQETVRGEDKIARLGGDEFVVLIEGLDEVTVLAVAERLNQETSRVYELSGYQVFASASIGIVTNLQRYENPVDILRNADIAMYRSKSQKCPYILFDDAMFKQVSEKQMLERDLRHALERKELFVVYQPIVDLKTQHIVGLEALLRWQHQDRLISPVEFIPIAEETGLIVPIGDWVLEEACKQLKNWQERLGRTDLYVTVNLSSRQLIQPNLVNTVKTLLKKTNLSAQSLQLEITESIIIENQSVAIKTLEDLRALGIYILMDDFGTGYSSLNYLTSLPIDRLKLDRSFSSQIESDSKTLKIVRTIIQLAHSVNMSVVAEGIESHNQAHLLNELNCEFGQGYLFAKPERPEKIEVLLKPSSITIHS